MTLEVALRHRFAGGATVEVAFQAPSPGVTALFGPSGAGKSTVIAACAGLLRPEAGRIAVAGTVLADSASGVFLPPERRRLGLVFQDARLFPHMSVATNLRFGQRRAPGPADPAAFDAVVALLGLGALLRRRPHTLSGGERQRVAIGRALLARPRLLLMDEPLASLDATRKAEILPFLARLAGTVGVPILYVTHALDEVVHLADHLVLIDAGRVVASGPVTELAGRADLTLAARNDAAAVLACRVLAHDPARGLSEVGGDGLALLVPLLDHPPGTRLRLRVPAREVILAHPDAAGLAPLLSLHNMVPGTVGTVVPGPDRSVLVEVACGPHRLLSRVTEDAVQRLVLAPGAPVLALVKSVAVEVVRAA